MDFHLFDGWTFSFFSHRNAACDREWRSVESSTFLDRTYSFQCYHFGRGLSARRGKINERGQTLRSSRRMRALDQN